MFIDIKRVDKYLSEILKGHQDILELLSDFSKDDVLNDKWKSKALKHTLLEMAEAMANVLQHLLAKGEGCPVEGYTSTILKAGELKIVDEDLSKSLKRFFDFRNSLIHRYWIIDDSTIYDNVKDNHRDFLTFIEQVRAYIKRKQISG